MSTSIIKKFSFAAAHRLFETVSPGHPCSSLHGHNYDCEIELLAKHNTGMIIDFSDLKVIINKEISKWDHKTILNSKDSLFFVLVPFSDIKIRQIEGDPTVENMSFLLATNFFKALINIQGLISITVRMHETLNSIGTYTLYCEDNK